MAYRYIEPTINWNPLRGEKLNPAWIAVLNLLRDEEWHDFPEAVDVAVKAGGITTHTASTLLSDAEKYGAIYHKTAGRKRFVRMTVLGVAVWLEFTIRIPPLEEYYHELDED